MPKPSPAIKTCHPLVEDWEPAVVPVETVAEPEAARELALISAGRLKLAASESAGAPKNRHQPQRVNVAPVTGMEFAMSVARGLSDIPRRLESRFLYDTHGSHIFERICEQPEYYLTRTEATILASAAADIARRTGNLTLVELGSGSSVKTQLLLEAFGGQYGAVSYTPVDVSRTILEMAQREIKARYPAVRVHPVHGTYEDAFPLLPSLSPVMLLFLGSTLGNLDAHEAGQFWHKISANLLPGNFCLLGIDINEDADSLNAAYNDAAGYSADFTRNLFSRMNRELGSALDTGAIDHVAHYMPRWRQVEIFARFNTEQRIEIAPLGSAFRISGGEMILTEISRKFRLKQIVPYLCTFGLRTEKIYSDCDSRVAVLLLKKV